MIDMTDILQRCEAHSRVCALSNSHRCSPACSCAFELSTSGARRNTCAWVSAIGTSSRCSAALGSGSTNGRRTGGLEGACNRGGTIDFCS